MLLKWTVLGFLTFAALLNVAISVLSVQQAVSDALIAIASKNWQETSGVIVSSAVEESLNGRFGRVFHPRVTYQYTVDGKKYTGTRVSITIPVTEAGEAHAISAKYFPGSSVTVYFQTTSPSESSLSVAEPVGLQVFLSVFFTAWFCLSAYMLFKLSRSYKVPYREFNAELKSQFRNRLSRHSSGTH
ncbi:MAG: DUF3592 domain-containing protein [Thiobacillus sp.]